MSSLSSPTDTLIRPIIPGLLEYYAQRYKDRPQEVAVYYSYVVAMYEHMAQSCEKFDIPVLNLYQIEREQGFPEGFGTGDGVHVSDEGDAFIADLLRELGYQYSRP